MTKRSAHDKVPAPTKTAPIPTGTNGSNLRHSSSHERSGFGCECSQCDGGAVSTANTAVELSKLPAIVNSKMAVGEVLDAVLDAKVKIHDLGDGPLRGGEVVIDDACEILSKRCLSQTQRYSSMPRSSKIFAKSNGRLR